MPLTALLPLLAAGSTALVAASGWLIGREFYGIGLVVGAVGAGWLGIIYAGLLSIIRDSTRQSFPKDDIVT